jgi:hypothetical protein
LTADRTAPASAVHRSGVDIEDMLYVEAADVQLDDKAAVTEGLPIDMAQECMDDIT